MLSKTPFRVTTRKWIRIATYQDRAKNNGRRAGNDMIQKAPSRDFNIIDLRRTHSEINLTATVRHISETTSLAPRGTRQEQFLASRVLRRPIGIRTQAPY